MIYIITQSEMFEYGYLNNQGNIVKFSIIGCSEDFAESVRVVLKHTGLGFKTIKEAKNYRAIIPVMENVKFYNSHSKKEVR